MKETDLKTIMDAIEFILTGEDWEILHYLSPQNAFYVILGVYLSNDQNKALGLDYEDVISIITSKTRISCIINKYSSFYQHDGAICLYNNLYEDIYEIVICIDAAILRCESQM